MHSSGENPQRGSLSAFGMGVKATLRAWPHFIALFGMKAVAVLAGGAALFALATFGTRPWRATVAVLGGALCFALIAELAAACILALSFAPESPGWRAPSIGLRFYIARGALLGGWTLWQWLARASALIAYVACFWPGKPLWLGVVACVAVALVFAVSVPVEWWLRALLETGLGRSVTSEELLGEAVWKSAAGPNGTAVLTVALTRFAALLAEGAAVGIFIAATPFAAGQNWAAQAVAAGLLTAFVVAFAEMTSVHGLHSLSIPQPPVVPPPVEPVWAEPIIDARPA